MPVGCSTAFVLAFTLSSASSAIAKPATKVAEKNFYAPKFSPDGMRLLVTGERMHGLSEIVIADGKAKVLVDEERVGVKAQYTAEGRVSFKAKRAGSMRSLVLTTGGTEEELDLPEPLAFMHRDHIYLRTPVGVHRLSSGDRFFAPKLSPDGSKVAFTGLATGVHVYDLNTGAKTLVGPGTAPTWSPDSQTLAYERTEDDGHNIVASDIWLWDVRGGSRALTTTDARHERHPAWSPNGQQIAFDDDRGAVFITGSEVSP
jgi:Tol biopolymer transport system component